MGETYLIDTNTVSDYFRAILSPAGLAFADEVIDVGPNLSVITRIELVGYNAPIAKLFQEFVSIARIYDLDEPVIQQTIALRKSRRIKLPDAIIAATALTYGLTLISHNTRDFENITSLKLLDLHQLNQ